MKKILVVAPHPDDETLGCGGTLLKHRNNGDEIHWLLITKISEDLDFSLSKIHERDLEIDAVKKAYEFTSLTRLNFDTMTLDTVPLINLIGKISSVIKEIKPEIVYLPNRNDAHSDHAVVFDATLACSKSFRYPWVKSVYAYETLSETEFGFKPEDTGFKPNLLVNIESTIDKKIDIMKIYKSELAPFPFPRSETCIRALAQLRGSQCNVLAAEAFMIIKEIR